MVRTSVKRLAANPHRRVRVKRRNAHKHKRKMSAKQIAIFGTKRQKAALKAHRRRKRTAGNPRRVTVARRARRVRRSRNTALVVTLGAANPKRRKKTVAKTRRRRRAHNARHVRVRRARRNYRRRRRVAAHRNPRRHYRRRRNRTRIVVVAPRRRRRANRRYSRRRNYHRRRHHNPPSLFGTSLTGRATLTMIGGGLVGVAAAKFLPTLVPAQFQIGGNLGRIVITGASAFVAGWLAGKLDRHFGDAVLFGGLMQAGSVALNAFLPGFTIGGVPIGMGELMPGGFPVPQNPLRLPPPVAPAQARVQMSGLQRAYGYAL